MTTKHEEITASVRERINAGDWAAGDRLPTTSALATEFATSRATVAMGLAQAGREGWITYTGARTGWRVAEHERRRRLSRNRLTSGERERGRGFFLSDAAAAGASPQVDTTVSQVAAGNDIAALLEIEPGDPLVQRARIMRLDGDVAQLATGHIPASIAAGTPIAEQNPGPGGIVARLEDAGHAIVEHIERVTPGRVATEYESDHLQLSAGSLVTEIVRVSYDADRPVLTERITLDPRSVELLYEIPANSTRWIRA